MQMFLLVQSNKLLIGSLIATLILILSHNCYFLKCHLVRRKTSMSLGFFTISVFPSLGIKEQTEALKSKSTKKVFMNSRNRIDVTIKIFKLV